MPTAPKPKYTKTLAPSGTHVARLYQIIYIGTVKGEYKGKPTEIFRLSIRKDALPALIDVLAAMLPQGRAR